jgi:hypothetical protein
MTEGLKYTPEQINDLELSRAKHDFVAIAFGKAKPNKFLELVFPEPLIEIAREEMDTALAERESSRGRGLFSGAMEVLVDFKNKIKSKITR